MFFNHIINIFKIILTVSFTLIVQFMYSQNTKIDSLETALQNHKAKDTTRVNILNHLAFHHYRNDPPKAISYVQKALQLAKEIHDELGAARSYYVYGAINMEMANFAEAIKNYDNAIVIYKKNKDLKGLEKSNNALGVLYTYKGDLELSLKHYEAAKLIAKQSNNTKSLHKYLSNIGVIYSRKGDYEKALNNFKNALNVNIKNKDSLGIINNFNAIANVYYEQGNYPISLEYYNKSLHIAKNSKDSIGVFQAYNNIGNLYRQQNSNEKALAYYNKAYSIKKARFNTKNVTTIKNNIAGIHYENKDYDLAITAYLESINLSKEINDESTNLTTAFNGLGFVYLETKQFSKALGYFAEAEKISLKNDFSYELLDTYQGIAETYFKLNKYDLSLVNGNKLVDLANKNESLFHNKVGYGILSEIYKIKGNYKEAFESHELFKKISDSILNEENIKKIAGIEYEYKYKKELDDAALRETKLTKTVETTSLDLEKSKRNLLLGIITFLVVAMVLGSIIFYLKLRNSKAKTENIITEQKLLRTQMTPHFIFNSLSVLQGMILNKEESKSVSYLSKFSKLLRITLENSRDKTVLLSHELEAVENYLSLQNIENEKITFQLHVDKAIEINILKVPPMLIQPFVENAIEHAFKNQKDNCVIEIKLTLVDSKLICIILDNGMGIDSSERNSNQNKKSLATKITKERLDYLSKDFKMDASITIDDRSKYDAQGTQVTIQMPYSTTEL